MWGPKERDDASRVDFTGGVLWSIRRTPKSEREVAGNQMNVECVWKVLKSRYKIYNISGAAFGRTLDMHGRVHRPRDLTHMESRIESDAFFEQNEMKCKALTFCVNVTHAKHG
jgi:hypothetical protein